MTEFNQKPCTNCRRRKVRCDKQTPCANCVRSNTRCIYEEESESNGVGPLILDRPTTIQLFDRLSGLEQMVSKLSDIHLQPTGFIAEAKETHPRPTSNSDLISGKINIFPFTQGQNGAASSEVPFPSLQESVMLIQFFLEVTEPFIRLLHVPFFHKQLAEYRAGEGENPLYFEPALHCIHALTISTLSSDFVLDFFHRPRDELLAITRKTAEEALTKADFMRSHQPNVLRALLYFINFLFEINDIEYASSLVGVALRSAFRIGLQYDYTEGSPFVRDRRRRIWFHLQYLDRRAANLLGVESTMKPDWDTPPPLNAFDDAWENFRTSQETFTGEPLPLIGFTDTSFVLARFEIETLQDQLRSSHLPSTVMPVYIAAQQIEIRRKYLTKINSNTHALQRFMMALLEIYISAIHIAARQAHHKDANETFRGETFIAGIELLEKISSLEDEMEYVQYVWMLRGFVPVQAIVMVLTCTLFESTPDCEARGWRQIDKVYARYDNADCRLAKSSIFEPINALREQALVVRRRREMQM